ncbi:MAG TPA: ankyrin repeat domain-containing protein [Candidatus Limnocylindria bacterium]|nr:ankyrin repeat domain-containing protein [Candidatus Limnocylindria bacterium]
MMCYRSCYFLGIFLLLGTLQAADEAAQRAQLHATFEEMLKAAEQLDKEEQEKANKEKAQEAPAVQPKKSALRAPGSRGRSRRLVQFREGNLKKVYAYAVEEPVAEKEEQARPQSPSERQEEEAVDLEDWFDAAAKGRAYLLQRMLFLYPEFINRQDAQGNTALILSAGQAMPTNNHKKTVSALLKMGANPNIQNKEGDTALIKAIQGHSTLKSSINLNSAMANALIVGILVPVTDLILRNRLGESALDKAVRTGSHDAVSSLLQHQSVPTQELKALKEKVSQFDSYMHDRLDSALQKQEVQAKAKVKENIVHSPSFVTPRDSSVRPGDFILAVENGADIKRLQDLVKRGADKNESRDVFGLQALHLWAMGRAPGVTLDALLNAFDYDINERTTANGAYAIKKVSGRTPLMMATMSDQIEAAQIERVRELLKHPGVKANINAQDDQGCTALYHAARRHLYNIFTLLLEAGANPDIVNNEKESARDLIRKQGSFAQPLQKALDDYEAKSRKASSTR